jgi:diguanylate cyclase (GGDEF)-like protein
MFFCHHELSFHATPATSRSGPLISLDPIAMLCGAAVPGFATGAAIAVFWSRRRRRSGAARELEALRQRLRLTIEALPGSFVLCGPQQQLLGWNSRFARLCARAFAEAPPRTLREALRGSQPLDMLPEESARDLAFRLARHDDPAIRNFEHRFPDGTWLQLHKQHLENGEIATFGLDVTALKAQERHLAAREARHRAMLDLALAGLWEVDEAGATVMANPRLAAIFGGTVPDSFDAAGLLDSRDGAPARIGAPGQSQPRQLDLPRGATHRRLLLTASDPLARPEGGSTRLLSLLDVTDQHLAEEAAAHFSRHDPLTGLENPLRFETLLLQAVAAGVPAALLSIELPGISRVNEQNGHATGDAALRAAAGRLRQSVRAGDHVFRLSGSKFGVLALDRDPAAALLIAERLHDALSEPFRLGPLDALLEPCIGLACAPAPELRDAEALRGAADLARKESRRLGGRAVAYTPALGEAARLRRRLRDALPAAVKAGELRLVWQPQRDARDRRLIGAEALLRWRSSALGREVMPEEIFPAAAKTGLLPAIDAWVLDTALATKRSWAARPGAPPLVAINISISSMRDPAFVQQVSLALLRHGLLAQELEIEISEDLPARDLDVMAPILAQLSRLGVQLALDDFGAGASSLAHLVRLPVNRVKLDRSIVGALPGGSAEGAILRAAVALARSLEIEVLAEGVETELQAAALRREGCTAMQGWLYGRPLEADALVPPAEASAGG